MDVQSRVRTDVAALVLFDPQRIGSRVDDDCDWWTGDGDLEAEERKGNLVFIATGQDGVFDVSVRDGRPEPAWRKMKSAEIELSSGVLLFGAAEHLPGEGVSSNDLLAKVVVPSGRYSADVYAVDPFSYCICIRPAANNAAVSTMNRKEGVLASAELPLGGMDVDPSDLISVLGQAEEAEAIKGLMNRFHSWSRTVDGSDVLLESLSCGIECVFNEGRLVYIHLHSGSDKNSSGFAQYPFMLPHALAFGMAREDVCKRFDKPFKGTGALWAIYRTTTHGVRVGYSDGKLVSLNVLSLSSRLMK